jgi:tape measure domain-containing protein
MELVRTLGVAIDPTAAKSGGSAVSDAFRKVGYDANEMEKKVDGADRAVEKTGETMQKTSRAGDQLRTTLTRQNQTLDLLTTAIIDLTAKLNVERVAVTATTDAHNKSATAMTRTAQEARNVTTAVDGEAKKMRESGTAAREAGNAKERAGKQARDAAGKFTGGAKSMLAEFKSLKSAIAATGLALFAADLLRTELQVQRTANALRFASDSAPDFARNKSFVSGTANTFGLNELSSSREFAKFMAAGKGTEFSGDQLRAVYLSVAKAATVLGLSSDETAGTLNALQQMISKGTVQAEELRGQLGERLPGAFGMAARAMGVTTKELGKMLEKGDITAYRLLPALAVEMEKAFGPYAAKAATSLNAEFNRMTNAWTNFKTTLMSSGVGEFFTNMLRSTTKILENTSGIIAGTDSKTSRPAPTLREIRMSRTGAEDQSKPAPSNPTFARTLAGARARRAQNQASTAVAEAQQSRADLAAQIEAGNKLYYEQVIKPQDLMREQNRDIANQENTLAYIRAKKAEAARKAQNRMRAERRDGIMEDGRETELAYNPEAKYSDTVAKLGEQYNAGAISAETFQLAVKKANEELRRTPKAAFLEKYSKPVTFNTGIDTYIRSQNGTAGIREAGREAGVTDEQIKRIEEATVKMERMRAIGTGTAQAINDGFGSFTDAMIKGTDDIGEAFSSMTAGILRDIAQITARQLIATPIAGALSSVLGGVGGSFFGGAGAGTGTTTAGVKHTGGIVGQSSGISRTVSSSLFTHAPRFHNGLKHDEFPAILQKGEEVIPKNQVGRSEASIIMPITVNVNSSDSGTSESDRKFGAEVARQIEGMIDLRIAKALSPQSLMRRSGR